MVDVIEKLERLGFKTAGARVKELADKKRKLAIAYEHYRFVREEKITAFNEKLKDKTFKAESGLSPHQARIYGYGTFQQLSFTPVGNYSEVPPEHVLSSLETAVGRGCFDSFEIAHIVTVQKLPDPILFGRIVGCPDRFFIDQWDNDCKIEDILKSNEG